ncbi:hemolysin family protein [Jonesia quinghaiensis]|uniref:hemolysin family protein n=1 Tax=Jonesia quinghaiensis TaxID=262806 RepID=UPI000420045F|nr:hemolysin family protein [Jonesia quinghaiensis]
MEVISIIAAIVLIAGCGMFVAAEFSLITVNKNTVKAHAEAGDRKAAGVLQSITTLSTQLSGAQLGITVTNLGIGFVAEPAIAQLVQPTLAGWGLSDGQSRSVSVVIALVLATGATMIFGELVPKNLAIAKPWETARAVAGFQRGFVTATKPLIRFFNGTANKVIGTMGIEPQEELASARSAEELAYLVRHSADQGALPIETAQLVERSFAFGERRAHDAMTPRSRMITIAPQDSAQHVLITAQQTGYSRFPVMEPGSDHVAGIVHVRGALSVPHGQRTTTQAHTVMGEATLVPDTLELDDLMDTLRSGHLQMAMLISETGDIAGLITLEDLVEELVGEVRDEHDPQDGSIEVISDHSWNIDASMRPDEVINAIGFPIPEHEDYETLAGLMNLNLGRIASVGDVLLISADGTVLEDDDTDNANAIKNGPRARLMVTEVDGHRVDRILITTHGMHKHHNEHHGHSATSGASPASATSASSPTGTRTTRTSTQESRA